MGFQHFFISVLFTDPSLLVVNVYRKFFIPSNIEQTSRLMATAKSGLANNRNTNAQAANQHAAILKHANLREAQLPVL